MGEHTSLHDALPVRRRLSAMQRSLVAAQLAYPESPALNMALLVEFESPVDPAAFSRAFELVVGASDALRTVIVPTDPEHARVAPSAPIATEVVDVAPGGASAWAEQAVRTPVPISVASYQSVLLDDGTGARWWLYNAHHIVTDATASTLVVEDTIRKYLGRDTEADGSFYEWVDTHRHSNTPSPSERTAGSRSAQHAGRAMRVPIAIDDRLLADGLDGDYRLLSPDLSLTALLLTATAIQRSGTTGGSVALTVPMHHRAKSTQSLVGPTLNMHAVQVRVGRDQSLREVHRSIAKDLLTLMGRARPDAAPDASAQAVVNVIPRAQPAAFADVSFSTRWLHPGAIDATHDVRVQATAYDRSSVSLWLDVPTESGEPEHAKQVSAEFGRILAALLETPDQKVGSVDLLGADETATIAAFETAAAAPPARLLGSRLRDALQNNHEIVLREGDDALTGDELWTWAVALAAEIDENCAADARLSVELPRSLQAVVAIYAVTIAGRSFVPIDPAQPDKRRDELRVRAGIARSFDDRTHIDEFRRRNEVVLAAIDPPADAEAYVLFTSGSTGRPKGVPITHGAIASYVDFAENSYFASGQRPIAPLFTALTFDLTLTSLFAPILRGGELRVIAADGIAGLSALAADHELNWCKATPSHLVALASLADATRSFAGFDAFVVGGEAFTASLAATLRDLAPDARVFNEYGPTEAVVGCMIHEVETGIDAAAEGAVSIGRPAPGVTLRVVDAFDRRVPVDMPGELLIASAGLTAGYLDEPADAPNRFVELDGTRFYRSGDMVVRDVAGRLTYLGRSDEELKIGGRRLNPVEVEQVIVEHPAITAAVVREWSPRETTPKQHCSRCGLPDNVPGVVFDAFGVCDRCHAYDRVAPAAQAWFKSESDLQLLAEKYRGRRTGSYDCVFLLSGGKDSTFGLYKLVELGFRPYALTYDNGFISEAAKDNARAAVADLGIDHEFVVSDATNEILRDSLGTFSDVCHGCYKALYTFATNKAVELGIPAVVTGLSRGQLFETRLIPGQFSTDRFDPDAIDSAVLHARKRYHRTPDLTNRLLDTAIFEDDALFEEVEFVDLYRYLDVELTTVLEFLDEKTPWTRPADTGRSSNCLVNVVGIRAHQIERGFHNYAEPYAWDVRLGHKQRDEAMAELDDPIDDAEIADMLATIGYTPTPRRVLTAWFVPAEGVRAPTPGELRKYAAERLPAWAVPRAFVQVAELAVTEHGKVAVEELPSPQRESRPAVGTVLQAETPLEQAIIDRWQAQLGIEPIGAEDDFFALGGDSLAAIAMVVGLSESLGQVVREELVFSHTTPRALATAIEEEPDRVDVADTVGEPQRQERSEPPELSRGERSMVFEQQTRPEARMFNVGRSYNVASTVDRLRFERSLVTAAARHEPFQLTFGTPRQTLDNDALVDFETWETVADQHELDARVAAFQRAPFDLDLGPVLRCAIHPNADGLSTLIVIVLHHVSGDHQSLDVLWADVDNLYSGRELETLSYGYADLIDWQESHADVDGAFWASCSSWVGAPTFTSPSAKESDGYLTRRAAVSGVDLDAAAGFTPVSAAVTAAALAVGPLFDTTVAEVALVSSTRTHRDADRLCGYLLNPLPIQVDVDAHATTSNLVTAVSRSVGAALRHRAYPFPAMVADAQQDGRIAPSATCLVSYVDDPPAWLAGAPAEHRMLFNGDAVADVSFFLERQDNEVLLGLEYRGSTVGADQADLLIARFAEALRLVYLQNDARPVVHSRQHKTSVLAGEPVHDDELLLPKMLRHMVSRAEQPACTNGDATLNWAQLGARASQLARQLNERGVTPGDHVCVSVERNEYLPVALLGTLLAGAAYVPVDPSYPDARVKSMVDAVHPSVILVSSPAQVHDRDTLIVSDTGIDSAPWDDQTPIFDGPLPDGDSSAYVIFTSGSTGTPNGVAITHRQIAASTNARAQVYPIDPTAFLLLSSISFDSSMVALFWTLATGGELIVDQASSVTDPDYLCQLFDRHGPSHVLCVPTLYAMLLQRCSSEQRWPGHVIVAGEACPPELVAKHQAMFPTSALTNEYGPTEATVWVTAHHCEVGEAIVPIGTPIPGVWTAVVDGAGRPVDEGVIGQLIVGGPNIAGGYIDVAASASRFGTTTPDNPLGAAGDSYFRTGDRVVQRLGSLQFLGRTDQQLSIGGVRIEPTEVESVLLTIPGIANAVVAGVDVRPLEEILASCSADVIDAAFVAAAGEEDQLGVLRAELAAAPSARPRLVAHLEGEADEAAVRRAMSERLPATHCPSIYVRHHELPRLDNGKIDRAAVIRQTPVRSAGGGQQSDGAGEQTLQSVQRAFAAVLGRDAVGPDESFFDLGGDSLAAFELVDLLESQHGLSSSVRAIHDAPTPHALSLRLRPANAQRDDRDESIVTVEIQAAGEKPPIFFLHHVGAKARFARALSKELGESSPVYALFDSTAVLSPFMMPGEQGQPLDIERTTARYVEAILEVCPTGPVVLLGHCQGGIFAHEAAHQLRLLGREVQSVIVVFDWHAPHIETWAGPLRNLYYEFKRESFSALMRARKLGLTNKLRSITQPLSPEAAHHRLVQETNEKYESHEYTPYDGRVLVVRRSDDPRWPGEGEPTGWGDVLSDLRIKHIVGAPFDGNGATLLADLVRVELG